MWTNAPLSCVRAILPQGASAFPKQSSIIAASFASVPANPSARHLGCTAAPKSSPRLFGTTTLRQTKTIKPHRLPSDLIPPYPYGERRIYKQSNRGLYGSARIRFGNNVAEKHNNKSRRFWRPNVHIKAFYSPALGARVKTRLTLRVLKTIRREGGIENYLLKSKPARIKELGPGGWNLRWILMQTQAVQQRLNDERITLGLEPKEVENRDDIVHFALDYATPGPLSMRSRETLEEMQVAVADAFVLGNDDLANLEGVEELSDEAELEMLKELQDSNAAEATDAADAKLRVDV